MTDVADARFADVKEIAVETPNLLRAAFPGVKFSVRSSDNAVTVTYSSPDLPHFNVRDTIWHLRSHDIDEWGALAARPITLLSGETVRGFHDLSVRNLAS